MTEWLKTVNRQWHYIFHEVSDERAKNWFMSDSPIPILILCIAYYRFVKKIGPEFMEHRKPYDLNKLMQIYNVAQVFINGWLAYEGYSATFGPHGNYSWTCQPLDKSKSPHAFRVASLTWMYYMVKIFDLLDTVFFVLRKKFNQVSFLHVYHHIAVLYVGYVGTKYYPDGQGFIIVIANSFVHAFMYTYYFLTNYNPEHKKKIWWKKYITQLQMMQFMFLLYHLGKVFFIPTCKYPYLPLFLFLPQNIFIFFLFMKFYKQTYLTSKQPVKAS